MTALDKYKLDHPDGLDPIDNGMCPETFGYLPEPGNCQARMGVFGDSVPIHVMSCKDCWNRKIPENKERENENVSYKVFENNDEPTCDLDYKAEYAKLEALVHQKDITLLDSMNRVQELEKHIERLTSERNMYRYGLHVVEAVLGRKILEE